MMEQKMPTQGQLEQELQRFTQQQITRPAASILFNAGEQNSRFYRLVSGVCHVHLPIGESRYHLARLKAGAWLGELPHGQPLHQYEVYCTEPCEFVAYQWSEFGDNHDLALLLYDAFSPILYRMHCARTLNQSISHLSQQISPAFLKKVLRMAKFMRFEAGQTLFNQGDTSDGLYLLLNGKLDVFIGQQSRSIGDVKRGQIFGEMSVLTGNTRSATVRAARISEVVRLSDQHVQLLIRQFPVFNQLLIKVLVQRIESQNVKLKSKDHPTNRALLLSPSVLVTSCYHKLVKSLKEMKFDIIDESSVLDRFGVDSMASLTDEELLGFLEEREVSNKINLLAADLSHPKWANQILERADEIWLLADATQAKRDLISLLTHCGVEDYRKHSSIKLVLVHPEMAISDSQEWKTALQADSHYHIRQQDPQAVPRLARQLTNQALGLILGGGGARGFAHIGALQAFEENKIPIDYVGGTSIGAVMGAWIAAGYSTQHIKQEINRYFVAENPLGDYTLPLISLSKSERLDRSLNSTFGERQIEDLPLPFFCISSDLSTSQERVHESGKLWRGVRASLAIPGVITPWIENGHFLVDGGLLNNLPCNLMREKNNGKTLAIDVSHEHDFTTELTKIPSPWSLAWQKVMASQQPQDKVPSILETLLRSLMLASDNRRKFNKSKVDFYLGPDVKGFGMLEFTSADVIIQRGYQAALPLVQKLKASLHS